MIYTLGSTMIAAESRTHGFSILTPETLSHNHLRGIIALELAA